MRRLQAVVTLVHIRLSDEVRPWLLALSENIPESGVDPDRDSLLQLLQQRELAA